MFLSLQFLIKFNEMYSRDFEKAKSLENFISEHCGNIRVSAHDKKFDI